MCVDCVHAQHHDHKTLSLEQKDREVKYGLNSLLHACKQQDEDISKRTTILNQCERDIEKCASEAIEQITQRHQFVQQAELKIFDAEVAKVNKWKEDKLKTFQKESSLLKHLYAHQQDIAESGNNLLKQTTSPDFISKSDTFLTCSHLAQLPTHPDTSWNRMLYYQPAYWRILDSEHFQNYTKEHILGYIAEEKPTTEAAEASASGNYPRKGSIQSEFSVAADSHITDFTNATNITTRSDISRISRTSRYSIRRGSSFSETPQRTTAEQLNSTYIKAFEGSHLKNFSSALFIGESMWICGWNTSKIVMKDNVFVNVKIPNFSFLTKQKKGDSNADSPTFMFPSGDYILFAKKKGSEVYSFHTTSHTFKRKHSSDGLSIAAMCGNDHHAFLLNENEPTFITVLDANLQPEGKIATHLIESETRGCNFDICLIKSNLSDQQARITMDHTIAISSSKPNGSVRAVNQTQGVLWRLDCRSSSRLDLTFNPCSVSCWGNGEIFIVDQRSDTVRSPFIILLDSFSQAMQWQIQNFPKGVCNPMREVPTYYLANFSENCMKMKNFWAGAFIRRTK